MSSLSRYKRSGGFYQLLSLIETFGAQKRERFLEMIQGESGAWASALREKMLSLERIFGWNEEVVIEIFKRLPPKSQAFVITGLKDDQKAKVTKFLSSSEQRRISDVLTESQPKPEEVQATLLRMVELTRQLLKDRELIAERFDPGLIIPEDIESRLDSGAYVPAAPVARPAAAAPSAATVSETQPVGTIVIDSPAGQPSAGETADVYQLKRTLTLVSQENKALKDEVRVLRDKLEQIRKIA